MEQGVRVAMNIHNNVVHAWLSLENTERDFFRREIGIAQHKLDGQLPYDTCR